MINLNKIIREVKEIYSNKKLIPFIGSGFSKPLELPSWEELIKSVAADIGVESDLLFLHGSYPQILDFVKKEHKSAWINFLHNLKVNFDSAESNKKRQSSETHKILGKLDFKTIYTTNYDLHIEKAISGLGKTPNVLSDLEDFANTSGKKSDCDIIKFHGDLKKENMILTETQYFERMALEEAVDQRLRSDLLSNSFLFIGYSFNDTNIRYIWYKIHKLKSSLSKNENDFELRKSYYITFGNEPIQSRLLHNWDIEVVSLDPENRSKSLAEFLNCLT